MKVLLIADGRAESGGSALLMHNERLADPLDPFTRAIGAISKKRNKTEADHLEIGRLEFLGGLYTIPVIDSPDTVNGNVPCVPGWNIVRCLQDGATRHKRGKDVLRGVVPLGEIGELSYMGATHPDEMWHTGLFLRKGVGISGRRVHRTRPLLAEWQTELLIEVDPTIFDLDTLAVCWRDAGVYCGLGDMRPIYGRFKGTVKETK